MRPSAWPPFQSLGWFQDDPFRLVVCCVLTARTKGSDSRVVTVELFDRFPDALALSLADEGEVFEIVGRLGFGRQRSRSLVRTAADWIKWFEGRHEKREGRHVWGLLYGCGKYAADSWDIFVRGRTDVYPDDGVLELWLTRSSRTTEKPPTSA
ncbi:hypothetical protein LCGC14_0747880 [marine sediment metagenome]|uniref:HhH-GPD domain-containing protein n=1 Tax=marine sediment metagenome TaxID=412755 RepID=A0A0F9SPW8_9ZZZZ